MKTKLFFITAISLCLANTSIVNAQEKKHSLIRKTVLSSGLAEAAALACIKRQVDNNSSKVAVAIYDASVNLMYFNKMDGAVEGATPSAMQKAKSSASFPFASGEMSNWVKNNPGVGHIEDFLGVQGALPIFAKDGTHLGAIGVSGAPAAEDESCAQAGIDAIKKHL